MRKIISSFVAVAFLLTTTLEGGALAGTVGSGSTASGNVSAQLNQTADATGPVQSFQADLFTGRAQTSIPIFTPPGRKNIGPKLNLSYSSSNGNGWIGVGWSLGLGSIQRDVKGGVPAYDSTDKFIASFQGVNSELVSIGSGEYRAKDESMFMKFEYDSTNDKWTVTDKSGTQYRFGNSSSTRQTNTNGTFKWLLDKIVDTSGNYMEITYTTDEGQVYLSQIDYNGNEDESFSHTHRVEFTLEDRTDDSFSYITGAKVATEKRLENIQVKVKNASSTYELARKYELDYEYSDSTGRSRLISVTEYGTDGTTSLPAIEFEYQDAPLEFDSMEDFEDIERDDSEDSSYDYVKNIYGNGDTKVDLFDINGDGLPDRVQAVSDNTSWKVQLNEGDGSFASMANFGTLYKPSAWSGYSYVTKRTDAGEQATDLVDINGDGLVDRVIAQDDNTSWIVQMNEGDGFAASNTSWGTISVRDSIDRYEYIRYYSDGGETKVDLVDMNGDGLSDRLQSVDYNTNWKVQWNTGTGFSSMEDFGTISNLVSQVQSDHIRYTSDAGETQVDLIDLNGDGLPDRVQSQDSNTYWKVQWNTGTGFTSMEDFGPIYRLSETVTRDHIRYTSAAGETQVDLLDLNGDGLPDRVQAADNNTDWKVQWNTGTGFTSMEDFGTISYMVSNVRYSYPRRWDNSGPVEVDMADIDGDGLPDRIQSEASNTDWKKQKNKGPFPDLLKEIDNGRGGVVTVTYGVSTQFDNTDSNGDERLPFPVHVVTKVEQEDGMGNTYTTEYDYEGGMFDAEDREFRGFREVVLTDAADTETRHWFYQDDTKKGRLEKKEVWGHTVDSSTALLDDASSLAMFSKEETTWSSTNPHTGVTFVYVSQQDNYIYDGDVDYKHTRQAFTYDSYGNLASTTEYGDVDVSGDERKTVNTYTYNTTSYILNTLAKTTLYDSDLTTRISERLFYYDGATAITTAPTSGLLTKEIEWLDTCANAVPDSCHPTTTMTYDDYGNVATITDARGYQTDNTYDSTYHLFLSEIENALDHTREFTYDAKLAQITSSTDANNQTTTTNYDVLGRVTKVINPLDSSAEPTKEFSYDLTSVPNKTTIEIKTSVPGDTFTQLTTYSFVDGLGREIQRRSPSETTGKQIVTGSSTFDSRGQIEYEYAPYEEDTATSYSVATTSFPRAKYSYDALGRRTRIDYPDASVSKVFFDDFKRTTYDPRGKEKRYYSDAYGRLVKVEEINSGNTYTTEYEYDVLNNLTETEDHLSNITTITYDSLSRKITMDDPDMGEWEYEYDGNDNLTSQTDAKDVEITFTYDALNRVTLKNLPAGETDVTYTYDDVSVDYSKGRLTKIIDSSGTHEFEYDKEGRVLEDKKTVDSTAYTFARTYDSMGRVRTLTYPDTEVVTYTYNVMGEVETISGLKSSVTTDYIKDVDYNAAGQITHVTYGNDVTSDYSYDEDTLRLDEILTKKSNGTTKLQELNYTFDANGNVSQITDTVNSMSQTFVYDDLNRLTQATGSAYGSVSYAYNAIGNMTTKGNNTMTYGSGAAGPHAVTGLTGTDTPDYCTPASCVFSYDDNGNMTDRGEDDLTYDSQNRLTQIVAHTGELDSTSFSLSEGWNLISFTYLPENKSITSVLSSLTFGSDYNQVSYYDPDAAEWKHFVNDSDFNDFDTFQHGKSYEIYINNASGVSFTVSGKSPGTDITTSFVSGDNFIGPAVKESIAITTVLSGLTKGTDYSDVKRYNNSTESFESYDDNDFTTFEPGKGYILVGLTSGSFSYGETTQTSSFVYDSTGSRVKKTVGSSTTTYFGKDYEVTSSTSKKYIFLGDRRISDKDSTGTVQFYHDDHISSSNIITDSDGDQVGLLEYTPYGSTATETGTADIKHKFTGQEEDDASGLYYYGHRYYDPLLGRFITADWIVQDPADPQTLNRYTYVRNNPVKFVDPTGNIFWAIVTIIGIIAVAAAAGGIINAEMNKNNGKSWGRNFAEGAAMSALAATAVLALATVAVMAAPYIAAATPSFTIGSASFASAEVPAFFTVVATATHGFVSFITTPAVAYTFLGVGGGIVAVINTNNIINTTSSSSIALETHLPDAEKNQDNAYYQPGVRESKIEAVRDSEVLFYPLNPEPVTEWSDMSTALLVNPAFSISKDAVIQFAEHTKGKRKSTEGTHQKGQKRRKQDQGGEKKDKRMKFPPKKFGGKRNR